MIHALATVTLLCASASSGHARPSTNAICGQPARSAADNGEPYGTQSGPLGTTVGTFFQGKLGLTQTGFRAWRPTVAPDHGGIFGRRFSGALERPDRDDC